MVKTGNVNHSHKATTTTTLTRSSNVTVKRGQPFGRENVALLRGDGNPISFRQIKKKRLEKEKVRRKRLVTTMRQTSIAEMGQRG